MHETGGEVKRDSERTAAAVARSRRLIEVFHGVSRGEDYDSLTMHGPDPHRDFFLTRSRSLATQAAGGYANRVLVYRVPEDQAHELLGEEKEYMGVIGEGREYRVPAGKARLLHKFLDPKQKKQVF